MAVSFRVVLARHRLQHPSLTSTKSEISVTVEEHLELTAAAKAVSTINVLC